MLNQLILQNYRGFDRHVLEVRPFTIAVGENNAGKSTVVEALRLVALVTERYRNLNYHPPPAWTDLPRREFGVSPSLKGAEINFTTLYHQYNDPPASATVTFTGGESITIRLGGEQEIFAVIRGPTGEVVSTRSQASALRLPVVSAMPQLSPLLPEESVLSEDYVRSSLSSPLASRHFRNQVYRLRQFVDEFRTLAGENWHHLQVRSLDVEGAAPDQRLLLRIRNRDFVGEIGLMGHGLQMWLQVIWFITRAQGSTAIILDEPDVYMHPDLQRRLVRFLRRRFQQIVITTHSVEIMSEVDPEEILIVDRRQPRSAFAGSLRAVQHVLSGLGSAQNIHLTRLWAAKRLLLVEGKDLRIFVRVHSLLFPDSDSLQLVPNLQIGGWSGWHYAVGSSMAFRNAMGEEVTAYCILDSDYHTSEEIAERLTDARARGVQLHVWSRKEIENYLIVPGAMARIIEARAERRSLLTAAEVMEHAVTLADRYEDQILDDFANEYFLRDRSAGHQSANRKARAHLRDRRERDGNLLGAVSGKALLADLSNWANERYGVSFGVGAILHALRRDEIAEELGKVVAAIENNWSFEVPNLGAAAGAPAGRARWARRLSAHVRPARCHGAVEPRKLQNPETRPRTR